MKGPGKDALARRAAKAARDRDRELENIRKYGADPGALEPCPYCGSNGPPDRCCDESRRSAID